MLVLVACEFSGVVREAFRAKGHEAFSCDLKPAADGSRWHFQGDVKDIMRHYAWDLMIAHPPCTALAVSGNRYYANSKEREEALGFVEYLLEASIPKICVENPVGVISTKIRKPDQIIQPYEFGDDASKKTCLWLKGLPPLTIDKAKRCSGRMVEWRGQPVERWGNQTDSGQNKLGPSEQRSDLRSTTYPGIANAMAEQWG